MLLLQLTLLFVLVLGGSSDIYLYHRAGDDVVLPCNSEDSSRTSCSNINWLDYRDIYTIHTIVHDGKIEKDSPQATKLSLGRRCSLTITNISSEDAGLFTCRDGKRIHPDTDVFLNILTLSANQSLDPEGGVTLTCSLRRNYPYFCDHGSLLLLDEEGAELERKDEDKDTRCLSFLTITHQSNYSRQFTCQFVSNNEVKISANYTLVSTVDVTSDSTPNKIIFILNIAKICLLIILVVIVTTVQIKYRRRTGAAEDAQGQDRVPDEQDSRVIYDNIG